MLLCCTTSVDLFAVGWHVANLYYGQLFQLLYCLIFYTQTLCHLSVESSIGLWRVIRHVTWGLLSPCQPLVPVMAQNPHLSEVREYKWSLNATNKEQRHTLIIIAMDTCQTSKYILKCIFIYAWISSNWNSWIFLQPASGGHHNLSLRHAFMSFTQPWWLLPAHNTDSHPHLVSFPEQLRTLWDCSVLVFYHLLIKVILWLFWGV